MQSVIRLLAQRSNLSIGHSLTVVGGGGPIGAELAIRLDRLGARVRVVSEDAVRLLPLAQAGIPVRLVHPVHPVHPVGSGVAGKEDGKDAGGQGDPGDGLGTLGLDLPRNASLIFSTGEPDDPLTPETLRGVDGPTVFVDARRPGDASAAAGRPGDTPAGPLAPAEAAAGIGRVLRIDARREHDGTFHRASEDIRAAFVDQLLSLVSPEQRRDRAAFDATVIAAADRALAEAVLP